MNCERFRSELGHAGRVQTVATLEPEFAQHALQCGECERWLDDQHRVDDLLDLWPRVEPSQGFAGRVVRRALAEDRPLRRLLHSRALRAAAAVLLLAGVGTTWWVTRSNAPSDSAAEPSPELLAEMDLLLDWDVLNQKGDALDAAADADVAVAVSQFDVIEDGG